MKQVSTILLKTAGEREWRLRYIKLLDEIKEHCSLVHAFHLKYKYVLFTNYSYGDQIKKNEKEMLQCGGDGEYTYNFC
jgi:hypothetical protein